MRILTALAALAALTALAACHPPVNRTGSEPPPTVPSVDLERYLGLWYEIARFPNRFEEDCEGVTAHYSLSEDGLIRVLNTCREGAPDGPLEQADGRVRVVEGSGNAKLKVSFFGPFWGDYWVLDLDPDYGWSLVGEPRGRYLWILSRTPDMAPGVLEARLNTLRAMGYDTDALYFPAQPPASLDGHTPPGVPD